MSGFCDNIKPYNFTGEKMILPGRMSAQVPFNDYLFASIYCWKLKVLTEGMTRFRSTCWSLVAWWPSTNPPPLLSSGSGLTRASMHLSITQTGLKNHPQLQNYKKGQNIFFCRFAGWCRNSHLEILKYSPAGRVMLKFLSLRWAPPMLQPLEELWSQHSVSMQRCPFYSHIL